MSLQCHAEHPSLSPTLRLPKVNTNHPTSPNEVKTNITGDSVEFRRFTELLRRKNIQVLDTCEQPLPADALLHDRRAPVPTLVVSPQNTEEVVQSLKAFKSLQLYERATLSVKSGGHGYFNKASCTGVMLNLSAMNNHQINGDVLSLEPGCLLGTTIDLLAKNHKAVPHGDCFGVGAGGHFLTAGWDLLLSRRFGLGCQSVVGGNIALWDGTVLEVNEKNHPELLYAMRGGAAAGAGVVTRLYLRLIEEPQRATWKFTRINEQQLRTCISHRAFSKSLHLPRDITVSFRFHFEPDQFEPVCSFNIVSLLTAGGTIEALQSHLGRDVTDIVTGTDEWDQWNEKTLLDLRLIPASDALRIDPTKLAQVTQAGLHSSPLDYWTQSSTKREMARSFFTSISYWIKPNCEELFSKLYTTFQEVCRHPARERMYALIILGGGCMSELQRQCAMPLGEALGRFELHWDDDEKDRPWSEKFTSKISEIFRSVEDPLIERPYRGDVWAEGQDTDPRLDTILQAYDRRPI